MPEHPPDSVKKIPSADDIQLRDMQDSDLPIFFENGRDPQAVHMAAFTAKDPSNREVFDAHWQKIRSDPTVTIRTILFNGQVAGSVLCHHSFGLPEVSYWLGREFWGKGIATRALMAFLRLVTIRPIYARVAKDNIASLRVLEKCGFVITAEERGYANARAMEIEEYVLELSLG
jgi:RimJ/RimL family protein N-acetyltransferase